ncbi:unnamed protein product [Closterium sp. NIES-64]|nr:unnamed protein product [Closterium sp. NIES-64]
MVQPLIAAAHSAGSRGAAVSEDSGGAVTTNVEERHAHRGRGGGGAGRAGRTQVGRGDTGGLLVGTAPQWPVGRRASEAEINEVVYQLAIQDPTAKELSVSTVSLGGPSLAYYLHLAPQCYPDLLQPAALELHAPEPSTTALRSLSTITHLTTLHITGTALDDSDLLCLFGFSMLTDVSLAAWTFAADHAVRTVIQGMTHLKSLDLSGTAISQGAAVHLQALERLGAVEAAAVHRHEQAVCGASEPGSCAEGVGSWLQQHAACLAAAGSGREEGDSARLHTQCLPMRVRHGRGMGGGQGEMGKGR